MRRTLDWFGRLRTQCNAFRARDSNRPRWPYEYVLSALMLLLLLLRQVLKSAAQCGVRCGSETATAGFYGIICKAELHVCTNCDQIGGEI